MLLSIIPYVFGISALLLIVRIFAAPGMAKHRAPVLADIGMAPAHYRDTIRVDSVVGLFGVAGAAATYYAPLPTTLAGEGTRLGLFAAVVVGWLLARAAFNKFGPIVNYSEELRRIRRAVVQWKAK